MRENFSKLEKYKVIELVEENLNIIENKKTDGVTTKQKEKAWQTVFEQYRATNTGDHRTVGQIQNLWKNLKQRTKKAYSSQRRERAKTGGGPPPSEIDALFEKVHSLIPSQIESLQNEYDCDSALDNYEEPAIISPPTETTEINDDDSLLVDISMTSTAIPVSLFEFAAFDANKDTATGNTLQSTPVAAKVKTGSSNHAPNKNSTTVVKKTAGQGSSTKQDDILAMAKEKHDLHLKYFEIKMAQKSMKIALKRRKQEMAEELHAAKMMKYQ